MKKSHRPSGNKGGGSTSSRPPSGDFGPRPPGRPSARPGHAKPGKFGRSDDRAPTRHGKPQRPGKPGGKPSGKPVGKPEYGAAKPADSFVHGQRQDHGRPRQTRPHQMDERIHWLWGIHPVEAALKNPKRRCLKLLASPRGIERLGNAAQSRGVRVEATEDDRLDRLLPKGAVHQGLALEVEPLARHVLDDVVAKSASPRLLVMLDQVNDPHNLGAVLRTAAAFGAHGVIVQERHSPPLSGVTAKSASGALEKIPVIEVVNLSRTLEELGREGFVRLGFDEDGAFAINAQRLDSDTVLVFGAEGEGLRRLTRENCDHLVRLPTSAAFSSLNVSNAVAIALYETVRQRTKG